MKNRLTVFLLKKRIFAKIISRNFYKNKTMKHINLFFALFCLFSLQTKAQLVLKTSQLPIMVVDTKSANIVENTKIVANIKVFDKKNQGLNDISETPTYESAIGIEYRGATSFFLSDKKPYNIELRDIDGITQKSEPFVGLPDGSDWAILAPYTDKTMIREAFMYRMAQQIMPWAPHFRFVELVINDKYLGVFMVCEKMQRDKNRINVSKMSSKDVAGDSLTGGYIFSLDKVKQGDVFFNSKYSFPTYNRKPEYIINYPRPDKIQVAQKQYITNWMHNFEDVMMGKNYKDTLNGYAKYIDVASFVDFVLLTELSRNVDGYRLSTYFAKDKDSKSPKMRIPSIWDYNIGMGNVDYCLGAGTQGWAHEFNNACPDDNWVISQWWLNLVGEQRFKSAMKKRWKTLRKTTLSDANVNATLDTLSKTIGTDAINRNFQQYPILNKLVWPNPAVYKTYDGEFKQLNTWLNQRCKWMDGQIEKFDKVEVITIGNPAESKAFPNPAQDQIFIEYFSPRSFASVNICIYDVLGHEILQKNISKFTSGKQTVEIDLSNFSNGVYIYTLNINGFKSNGKFVKS